MLSVLDKVSLITPALCHFAACCQKTNYMVRQQEKWAACGNGPRTLRAL